MLNELDVNSLRYSLYPNPIQSFRLREADLIVVRIEDGVELADEYIAENPERAGRRRNVHAHKAGQADGLTEFGHLQ